VLQHHLGEPPTAEQFSKISSNILDNLKSVGVLSPEVFPDPDNPYILTVKFWLPNPPTICVDFVLEEK
jgi:hypothetical protein